MRSIQSSRSRTAIAATERDGDQDADEAEEGPHYQQREHHYRGVEETARLITSGCIRYDSIVWMTA